MKSESIRIPTGSGQLAGRMLHGQAAAPAPAILLESGLAASTDEVTQSAAQALHNMGWTVVMFDHAGFGNSGGNGFRGNGPGKFKWKAQLHDLTQAWWWLRKRVGIDGNRVGIWAHGLGAWRARLLAEHNPDLRSLVLQEPVWRQRNWLTSPAKGFRFLQEAGYFAQTEPDPLANPQWTLAWLELLRAPLPKASRGPDVPTLLWQSASNVNTLEMDYSLMGKSPLLEVAHMPADANRALTTANNSNPVMGETDAFFRQYL